MDRDAVLEFLDAEEDALLELDEAAFESAYLRTWVDTERAEFIVSAVIAMNKPLPPTEFFEDLGDPDPGYKLFKIPGVPNSKGAAGGEGALAVYIKRHHNFVTALLTERPTDPKRLIPIVQGHVKGPLASLPEATDPLSHVVRRLAARHRVASAAAASAVVALVTGWWRHRRRRSLRTAIITFG
jgi:hypothetical protein